MVEGRKRGKGGGQAGGGKGNVPGGGSDRRRQIVEAALEVFAREGFEKATIKKIAAQAGIKSAALIYWYFDNKAELLEASLIEGMGQWGARFTLDPNIEPRKVLEQVARAFMDMLSQDRVGQVMRIGLSQILQRPDIFDRFVRQGPLRVISALENYLSGQVELGRLKPHDSSVVARLFLFGLFGYALHHEVAASLRHSLPPPERYVSSILEVLQWGIQEGPDRLVEKREG